MRLEELGGRRVAVWGAGREARAAVTALSARLPQLRFALICRAEEADAARVWCDPQVELIAHAPDADLLARFDVVIKSPGISPYFPPVPEAGARGVRFISGSALWFAEHPGARIIAVTGTKGKSTTSAMIAHLLRAAGKRVALCGNIGVPLLELLDPPHEPDWWVMELSSFQTPGLDAVPEIALVLNLYPEHLDWHGDVERYYADKLALLGTPERRPRLSVLSAAARWPSDFVAPADVAWFGDDRGFHLRGDAIWCGAERVLPLADLPLPGEHNALNACAALAAVAATGLDAVSLANSLATFRPLPHRLQTLGVRDGLTWVNDSIATTPHATLAALAHFQARAVTVLVGGHDRGVDWSGFRRGIAANPPRAVIAMGRHGEKIAALLSGLPHERPLIERAPALDQAVLRARQLSGPGGVVLLSPGAPSFGEFRDYIERGRRFAQLAGFDPDRIGRIEGLGL